MGQKHAPAAVSGDTEIVEDLFRILAFLPPCLEFFPRGGNGFSTGKTSYGYQDFRPLIYLLI
jgi:hypothetical protein